MIPLHLPLYDCPDVLSLGGGILTTCKWYFSDGFIVPCLYVEGDNPDGMRVGDVSVRQKGKKEFQIDKGEELVQVYKKGICPIISSCVLGDCPMIICVG